MKETEYDCAKHYTVQPDLSSLPSSSVWLGLDPTQPLDTRLPQWWCHIEDRNSSGSVQSPYTAEHASSCYYPTVGVVPHAGAAGVHGLLPAHCDSSTRLNPVCFDI